MMGFERVPRKEYDRIMRLIREQTREYPQNALEEIFLYLEMIKKRHGIEGEDAERDEAPPIELSGA
jgi:hypothetical protein